MIIALDFALDALKLLKTKPNFRFLKAKLSQSKKASYSFHSINGGVLAQQADTIGIEPKTLIVDNSQRQPSK
ncbi:hypothetical protein [Coxiella-like endosymbiont of Rhipicephalus sanguineus]|uniref:hypothetical protein n=1 Tax=Coxiella-like endosymbiont of Rhipicephalus sanguineus TaxID=1955402 RepID=UPI00203B39F6|nr:hypothetical protein [Coxiella-like endosymbiont of Rhipicephalus sanguineus]